jgi:hypothetical protein
MRTRAGSARARGACNWDAWPLGDVTRESTSTTRSLDLTRIEVRPIGRFRLTRATHCPERSRTHTALKSSSRGLPPESHELPERETQNRPISTQIGGWAAAGT